ncbi:MAG: ester cyclase, partial [Woeseiaceae bacterium]
MLHSFGRVTVALMLAAVVGACSGGMSEDDINNHATQYTAAWNSGDPGSVSMFFSENGSLKVNDAAPAVGREAITDVANGFMTAFPDMALEMLELRISDESVQYHWRFTGTNTGPGGTGAPVDFSGYEEWTFGEDNLVMQSLGHFDNDEYLAQVNKPRTLSPGSSDTDIVAHMLQHEKNQTQTDALSVNFPDLSRERAYAIQQHRLEQTSSAENAHVGWKLGWTRMTNFGEEMDPIMGHYLQSRVHQTGTPVSTRGFTEGTASAEPEIVFYLKKDLPGPTVTRDELLDAIEGVGIAMEFVNWRALEPRTREHAIADNGIAAGVILGQRRYDVRELDFSQIEGSVTVNSAETSIGRTTSIMGKDPVEGLLWAANELPKYGMHLKAGQFVVSGTVCPPLPVSAGDTANIAFTG